MRSSSKGLERPGLAIPANLPSITKLKLSGIDSPSQGINRTFRAVHKAVANSAGTRAVPTCCGEWQTGMQHIDVIRLSLTASALVVGTALADRPAERLCR